MYNYTDALIEGIFDKKQPEGENKIEAQKAEIGKLISDMERYVVGHLKEIEIKKEAIRSTISVVKNNPDLYQKQKNSMDAYMKELAAGVKTTVGLISGLVNRIELFNKAVGKEGLSDEIKSKVEEAKTLLAKLQQNKLVEGFLKDLFKSKEPDQETFDDIDAIFKNEEPMSDEDFAKLQKEVDQLEQTNKENEKKIDQMLAALNAAKPDVADEDADIEDLKKLFDIDMDLDPALDPLKMEI